MQMGPAASAVPVQMWPVLLGADLRLEHFDGGRGLLVVQHVGLLGQVEHVALQLAHELYLVRRRLGLR